MGMRSHESRIPPSAYQWSRPKPLLQTSELTILGMVLGLQGWLPGLRPSSREGAGEGLSGTRSCGTTGSNWGRKDVNTWELYLMNVDFLLMQYKRNVKEINSSFIGIFTFLSPAKLKEGKAS